MVEARLGIPLTGTEPSPTLRIATRGSLLTPSALFGDGSFRQPGRGMAVAGGPLVIGGFKEGPLPMRKFFVAAGLLAGLILFSLVGLWLAERGIPGEIDSERLAVAADEDRTFLSRLGRRRPVTLSEVRPGIHVASGNGSAFRIDTPDGAVVIDTRLATHAERMRELLLGVSDQPVKYVILTHAHPDHVGGAPLWVADGIPVIAGRFFRLRNLEHRRVGPFRGLS